MTSSLFNSNRVFRAVERSLILVCKFSNPNFISVAKSWTILFKVIEHDSWTLLINSDQRTDSAWWRLHRGAFDDLIALYVWLLDEHKSFLISKLAFLTYQLEVVCPVNFWLRTRKDHFQIHIDPMIGSHYRKYHQNHFLSSQNYVTIT